MTNNRRAGKRWERWFINHGLKEHFPNIRRNAGTQSQSGGVDLENTPGFNFEVKGGKKYKYKGIRKIIDQVKEEGDEEDIDVALVKPSREEPYALIPFDDFKKLLAEIKDA